ncbi:hypothetical protein Scani_43930 [Streptomyces caniferus]|uniref:Uncharacterized protein n=1 Tax=Streptomyces caniferus TaxID=285557 RepID=A0A640SEX4_9ACTN|nr:hypothetical protein Scani_43930 [Streptomyces caniferus]
MTVSRVRPWFLPTSLAAFWTEDCPDGAADDPSDAGPDAPSGSPSDTRSGDSGPTGRRPGNGAPGVADEGREKPADRP